MGHMHLLSARHLCGIAMHRLWHESARAWPCQCWCCMRIVEPRGAAGGHRGAEEEGHRRNRGLSKQRCLLTCPEATVSGSLRMRADVPFSRLQDYRGACCESPSVKFCLRNERGPCISGAYCSVMCAEGFS